MAYPAPTGKTGLPPRSSRRTSTPSRRTKPHAQISQIRPAPSGPRSEADDAADRHQRRVKSRRPAKIAPAMPKDAPDPAPRMAWKSLHPGASSSACFDAGGCPQDQPPRQNMPDAAGLPPVPRVGRRRADPRALGVGRQHRFAKSLESRARCLHNVAHQSHGRRSGRESRSFQVGGRT